MVKAKIIATLGPASSTETILRKMMLKGMDVARLNFSHGTREAHLNCIRLIRKFNKKYRRHIRILGDLEGYRIRIGRLKNSKAVDLKKRQRLCLTQDDIIGEGNLIAFDYKGDLRDIKNGQYIYIDDGRIALAVEGHAKRCLKAKVLIGGMLKEHKGVNIPGVRLRFSGLTEKDGRDLRFAIDNRLDFIAQSFVRTKSDMLKIRDFLKGDLPKCQIIAKIENREGIRNIDEIIEVSDGIMIARGDMGISLPIYEVPIIQKEIIKKCNRAKKFVITATQMLESMVENHIPTRAEVTDVANAIIDGSDYLMLSAETAVGRYPVETVEMMNNIIKFTESRLS